MNRQHFGPVELGDTGYRADPEAFARQMETFDRMREINAAHRAARDFEEQVEIANAVIAEIIEEERVAASMPGYPKSIDLRSMRRSPR